MLTKKFLLRSAKFDAYLKRLGWNRRYGAKEKPSPSPEKPKSKTK